EAHPERLEIVLHVTVEAEQPIDHIALDAVADLVLAAQLRDRGTALARHAHAVEDAGRTHAVGDAALGHDHLAAEHLLTLAGPEAGLFHVRHAVDELARRGVPEDVLGEIGNVDMAVGGDDLHLTLPLWHAI